MRMVSKVTVVLRRWEIGASFFKGVAILPLPNRKVFSAHKRSIASRRKIMREFYSTLLFTPTILLTSIILKNFKLLQNDLETAAIFSHTPDPLTSNADATKT